MLRELAPRPGDTVLELAAGVGDTGFEAAAIVGEHGRLISSDFSPAMLDAARRRGAELGVANVDYRRDDAERIELDDDSVDGVLCRFGYMLMADPAPRSRRRAASCAPAAGWRWRSGAPRSATRSSRSSRSASSTRTRHLPPPEPTARHLQHGEPERTAALLGRAGFARRPDRGGARALRLPDVDEYLDVIADTAGPLGLALQRAGRRRSRGRQGRRRGLAAALRCRPWVRAPLRRPLRSGELRDRRGVPG